MDKIKEFEIIDNNTLLKTKNFLNNQNYVIAKKKNRVISNFIWFKNLSLLNFFIVNNIIIAFFSVIIIFLLIFSIFFSAFFYLSLGLFIILFIEFLFRWIKIQKPKKFFYNEETILNTKSYLFSEKFNQEKLVLYLIFVTSFIPFIIAYIWFLLFNIIGVYIFFFLWFIFITTPLFKKIWKQALKIRVVNILFFPLFLFFYPIANIWSKNNYFVYVKNPNFKIFNWFKTLSYYKAENEDILVIKQ